MRFSILFKACFFLYFSVFFLVIGALTGQAREDFMRVKWVPDGDTLYARSGDVYRLQGIDAPETANDNHREQYYASESGRALWNMVKNKKLSVDGDDLTKDRYGRYLAKIYLPDKRCVNRIMLRKGLAFYYPHGNSRSTFMRSLLKAQRRAINSGKGFWPAILALDNPSGVWLGNKNSKRFHSPMCKFGQKINSANKKTFHSLREAFRTGYAPCRHCTPWPEANN